MPSIDDYSTHEIITARSLVRLVEFVISDQIQHKKAQEQKRTMDHALSIY